MNGKVAKRIRKQCGFKVGKPRKYYAAGDGKPVESDMYRQGYQSAKKEYKDGIIRKTERKHGRDHSHAVSSNAGELRKDHILQSAASGKAASSK
jgi:hypothetical protein